MKYKFTSIISSFAKNKINNAFLQNVKIQKDINLKRIKPANKAYLLYIHVPFCHTFCPFCSFHKYKYDEFLAKKYFENLRLELLSLKEENFTFNTIYVGGGTTLINENEIIKTLTLAKELFGDIDISVETDPSHISKNLITNLKGLVTRLSIGVQSFDDEILKKMGRFEKFGSANIIQERLSNITGILPITSIDLIFNLPSQTKNLLLKDLKIAKNLKVEQITTYPLMNSNITKKNIAKSLGITLNDNEFEFYNTISDYFKDYIQLNSWSFSNKNNQIKDEYTGSNHEYIGIGSGAFSFVNDTLYINTFKLDNYEKQIQNQKVALMAKCTFSKKEKIKFLFLNSLFDGVININHFENQHDINLKKTLFQEILLLKLANAIIIENNIIKTTHFGKYLSLVMMKEFYTNMDKIRAMFR